MKMSSVAEARYTRLQCIHLVFVGVGGGGDKNFGLPELIWIHDIMLTSKIS